MAQVLDYSGGFPGAARIAAAGYVGAVRYIGFPDRSKCTTADELADFMVHGLRMALVFENTTIDWRGGFARGQASGRRARDHANAIGFPADRPIYMAVDQDVVTAGEFDTMLAYLRGASTSLGGAYVTGVYGEADVIDRARAYQVDGSPVCTWFWQTSAWSRGRRTEAHLFQRVGTVKIGGIDCDINDVLADDWGQTGEIVTPQEIEAVAAKTAEKVWTYQLAYWRDASKGGPFTVSAADTVGSTYNLVAALSEYDNTPDRSGPGPLPVWVRQLRDVDMPMLKTGQTEILTATEQVGAPSDAQIQHIAAELAAVVSAQLGGTYQVTITRATPGEQS